MKRRNFIKSALGFAAATQAARVADALTGQETSAVQPANAQKRDQNPTGAGTPAGQLKVEAYSRFLQWLRTPAELAAAVNELGFTGLDLTVRPYPGHVDPARVAQDLPEFVRGLKEHGVAVKTIAAGISDADSPHAEEILETASALGIHYYWGGTFRYDLSRPILAQLDQLKPQVEKLVALNKKYGMTAMYHTYTFPAAVGSTMWDLMYLLRDFDPAHVGIHYDTSHMVNAQLLGGWQTSLLAAGPYIRGLSVKDSVMEKYEPVPSRPAGENGARPRQPRRGMAPSPFGGIEWREKYTPLGQGNVSVNDVLRILKTTGFNGPVEIQIEYPDGGADQGSDKISLPRAQVLKPIHDDLLFLQSAAQEIGFTGGTVV
jgi:sugar phosphate isomerase/epimerase